MRDAGGYHVRQFAGMVPAAQAQRVRRERSVQKILLDRPLPNVYLVHLEVRRALLFLARLHEKQLIAQEVLVDEAAEYVDPLIVAGAYGDSRVRVNGLHFSRVICNRPRILI